MTLLTLINKFQKTFDSTTISTAKRSAKYSQDLFQTLYNLNPNFIGLTASKDKVTVSLGHRYRDKTVFDSNLQFSWQEFKDWVEFQI